MILTRRLRAVTIVLASLVMASSTAYAQPQDTAAPAGCTGLASATWLRVVASGLRNSNGLLAVTLYADIPSKFLAHHGSLYVGRVNAVAGTTSACIFVPQPGIYAIALYHDENANQKFDRTAIGLPAEGYGFSNNPPTLVGLPSFRSVRLNVPRSGLTTRITMKYP
jgi:uncharacterized protein (DUF2141 family)